jgi:hypothetical protein
VESNKSAESIQDRQIGVDRKQKKGKGEQEIIYTERQVNSDNMEWKI